MIPKINLTRLLFLSVLILLAAGCGIQGESWAGVSNTDDNEIFISYQRFIAKLDAQGNRIWVYPPKEARDATFFAGATFDDDTVYVGDYTGGVHAIDRETGDVKWTYEQAGTKVLGFVNFGGSADRVIAPVTIGDGVLFVPSEEGVFALDRETGERDPSWRVDTERGVWSQPLFTEERLYITSLDHHLYAVDPVDGSLLWKTDLGGAAPGSPVPNADGSVLFVGTFGSEVLAVNAENGEIITRYVTRGWVWGAPSVHDDMLYFGDLDGYLYAVSFSDGAFSEEWVQHVAEPGKLRATPLVTDTLIVVGSTDKNIYAVERETGNPEWSHLLNDEAVSTLVEVAGEDDMLVVTATNSGEQSLVGLRLVNGNEVWAYRHED